MTLKINEDFEKECLELVGIDSKILPELKEHWREPHRVFHTLEHLNDLYRQIENISEYYSFKDKYDLNCLVLTALFHDIIYDPLQNDNEYKSGCFFLNLKKTKKKEKITSKIWVLISHTKDHIIDDSLSGLFNSLDMNIVFRDIESLYVWETKIRKEYDMVPKEIYKEHRLKFLYSLIQNPIYMGNFKNLKELIQIVERKY